MRYLLPSFFNNLTRILRVKVYRRTFESNGFGESLVSGVEQEGELRISHGYLVPNKKHDGKSYPVTEIIERTKFEIELISSKSFREKYGVNYNITFKGNNSKHEITRKIKLTQFQKEWIKFTQLRVEYKGLFIDVLSCLYIIIIYLCLRFLYTQFAPCLSL